TENSFFPGEIASISEPFNLRTTRGITVKINPYQYNPVTQTLRVYQNIELRIEIDGETVGINELVSTAETPTVFANLYSKFYLNNNAVMGRYTPKEEEGDLLIIAGDSFLDE